MQLKKNNIIIISMILLLFVIGYAYNIFTDSKYIGADYDPGMTGTDLVNEDSANQHNNDILNASEDSDSITAGEYNPFEDSSNVSIVKNENITSEGTDIDQEQAIATNSTVFFSEYRLERDKNRSREAEMWTEIINNPNSEQTFKDLAQKEIVNIVALTEKEMMIEQLIISRGFNDALVFITDDSASVIVEAKELTPKQVAQIQDIVVTKTKLDPTNIRIMTKQ